MNGAEYVVQTLKRRGVTRIFALCGNGLDPLLGACLELGMPVVDVRNEQAAAYMADTWGRFTGSLGVVAVSSGPGHTNALTGLANAHWDGGPLLLISGASEVATLGMDHFQELDQVGMAAPVCKLARRVYRAETLAHDLEAAVSLAVTSRPGPVHLTIPVDVLRADVARPHIPSEADEPARVSPSGAAAHDDVARAAELLAEASRPIVLVGSGAFYADAWQPLRDLATRLDIPVLSHLWDRGCIEEPIPQYVGVTNDELNGAMALLPEADLLVAIGARLDYRIGYARPPALSPQAGVVRIDADPAEVVRGRTPDVGICANPRRAVHSILTVIGDNPPRHSAWRERVRAAHDSLREFFAEACADEGDACPLPGLRICQELRPFLDRGVTFLLDGGNIGRWAHLWLFDRHPAHWFTCGASGVVGWGLPGASAARMARPDHPVLLLSGDGAAGFTFTEVETALRFGTPYVAVIAHDGAWGIVADGQPQGRRVASELGEIRFDLLAEALGARGVLINHADELAPAVEEGLALDTVTVIQVPTARGGLSTWKGRKS